MDIGQQFYEANAALKATDFTAAQKIYKQILDTPYSSGVIHYNLGIAYYRDGKLGEALFHFIKAKKFLPRDADVAFNLEYSRKKTTDKIESKENVVWQKIDDSFVLNVKESTYTFAFSSILLTIALIISLFKKNDYLRWATRIAFTVFFIIGAGFVAKVAHDEKKGVITSQKANIYSGKSLQSVLLFTLHTGTEFIVNKNEQQWIQIALADGKKGWLQAKNAIF